MSSRTDGHPVWCERDDCSHFDDEDGERRYRYHEGPIITISLGAGMSPVDGEGPAGCT